jgi:type I restriction enzyme M protein
VKANVLFFNRNPAGREAGLWVYDLREGKHFTLRKRPIQRSDFDEFIACYHPEAIYRRQPTWSEENPQGRWRRFEFDALLTGDQGGADLTWLRSEEVKAAGEALPSPQVLATQITTNLLTALERFQRVSDRLS